MQTKRGGWQKGQSGNPKGKPPGTGELQRLRAAIAEDVPEIMASLKAAAKGGDTGAARLLLERVVPPVKAIEQALPMDLPDGSLTEKGRAILEEVAKGNLAPSQGAQLLTAIGTLAKVSEIDELTARISALEQCHAAK